MRRYACFAVTFAFILCPLIGRAQTTPAVTSGGILNAASLTADSSNIASPGGLVSIFGKNLASAPASASTSPLPLNLGGTVVQIGNVYAPLLFVSPGQINAQIPFEAAPGTQNLVVWVNGHASAPVSVVIQPAAPGIFTVSQSGVGTALATHADGSAVSAGAPAIPGETIQVSVTGLGLTLGTPGLPAVQSGDIGRGQPTLTVPTATIGSVNAPVVSASASQGLVGQFSVKLVVPTAGTGDQLLTISAGGNTTKAAVSLPIGSPSAAQGGGGAGGAGGTSAVPNGPVIFSGGILNAASLDPASNDTAAPGSLISIFGNNLATATASGGAAPLPLQIGGTSVLIGGVSAPLLLVSASQVNAQVPFEIQPGSKISVVVVVNGVSSNAEPLQIVPSAPGIFSTAGNGTGTADVFHSDNTPVTNSAPALPGEEVTIYCTGLGATLSTASLPAVKTGQPGQGQLTILSPTVTMGGKDANVTYSAAAPGVAGEYIIKIIVPDVPAGDQNIVVTDSNNKSRDAVSARVGFLFGQPPAFFQLDLAGSFTVSFGVKVKSPSPTDANTEIDEIASFSKSIASPGCTIEVAGTDGPTYTGLVHCQDYSDPNNLVAVIFGLQGGQFANNKLVFTQILNSTVNHFFYIGVGQTPTRSLGLVFDAPIKSGAVSIDLKRPDFAAGDSNIVGTIGASLDMGDSGTIPAQTIVVGGGFSDTITFVRR